MARRVNRVTIRDIAQELGITAMTVSRALNNKSDISPETKQRVIETAKRLGYVQSALGRGLASGYTKAVGCVVTSLTDPFVGRILEGIEGLARDRGFALIVTASQPDPERQMSAINTLSAYRVAGIIVLCSRVRPAYLAELMKLDTHIVLINSELSSQQSNSAKNSIRIDDIGAAKSAVSHLIELGHRRIAHLTVADGSASSQSRWAGYKQTLEEHGLECDPALTIETESSEFGGAEATRKVLGLQPRPTAIFCYEDQIAVGALAALRQAGLKVPQEMSVVGIDDIAMAAWVSPPLTTVQQPTHKMGQMAVKMVLRQLEGKSALGDIVTPGELIIRESSAPPPDASGN